MLRRCMFGTLVCIRIEVEMQASQTETRSLLTRLAQYDPQLIGPNNR